MASKNVVELTNSNWQTEVMQSNVPVVVDFWAVWCGPCRMIAPHIEQLADEYAGQIKVGKLNVDDSQEIAAEYRINTIPQVFIFKGGQVKERIVGAEAKAKFKAAIDRVLQA
jgi:thioredoxin 1